MPLVEQLFGFDSDAVLTILGKLEGPAGADARWRLALRGMDQLLDDLTLTLAEKQTLMEQARSGFANQLGVGAGFDRQLGERFRRERLALETLLDRRHDADSDLEPGFAAFAVRSAAIAPLATQLRVHADAGHLGIGLIELGASLVHMHANRIFRGAAREQEIVLYDFLLRLYQGQKARQKRLS